MTRSMRLITIVILTTILLSACQSPAPTVAPTTAPSPMPTVAPTVVAATKPAPTAEVKLTTAPTVAPTTASAAKLLITDLVVNDKATAANWSIASNFQIGDQQFGDRAYAIAKMPAAFAGSDWIRTAMDGKNYTSDPLVTFKVTADADVYVAFDDRVVTKPAWFNGWGDTGDDIVNSEPTPTVFSIFKKSFPANATVTLGQNGQSKTCGQYMVIVRRPGQAAVVSTPNAQSLASRTCPWDACLAMPADWYGTNEAIRIADNVLLYQRNTGGWYKNIDMAEALNDTQKNILLGQKTEIYDSTIDNNATTTQIQYLARVYSATKQDRFKEAFTQGLDYLFKAQYDNGGWPQYNPVDPNGPASTAYWAHITFNDNAMINVMTLLRAVATDPAYDCVDKDRRAQAAQAVQKGIALILKTQVVVNGKKTAWCAQYDEKTLKPAQARAYELESISGQESVPIVRFLMNIDKPSPEIIDAIQSAVKWFESAKITGIEVVDKREPSLPGGLDRVVVPNPNAPPIWARFYDIQTNKPFFVGRDSVKKETLAEIEQERRIGYSYYTTAPGYLLATEYPAWQKRVELPK